MGFNKVKLRAIDCIKNDNVRHIERDTNKNIFAKGNITSGEMVRIIGSCRGDNYSMDEHHLLGVEVHVLKPKGKYDGLYIKFFFDEADIIFISVHNGNIDNFYY